MHHHQHQQQPHHPEQLRSRSQSLGGSTNFLDSWRSRMPFLKRRQTIDNSRQCQPLMEEREVMASRTGGVAGGDLPVAGVEATLMTTIAEDVASEAVTSETPEGSNPNGRGTVIVRMEQPGQQNLADEAL
ncbi:uncharacterized protein [Drosophila bipectinata]|uniref:uncharacterized protein n=1 Tax=Drosophila bipectinata TaxID=42026 RepID=UPI0038B2D487